MAVAPSNSSQLSVGKGSQLINLTLIKMFNNINRSSKKTIIYPEKWAGGRRYFRGARARKLIQLSRSQGSAMLMCIWSIILSTFSTLYVELRRQNGREGSRSQRSDDDTCERCRNWISFSIANSGKGRQAKQFREALAATKTCKKLKPFKSPFDTIAREVVKCEAQIMRAIK